MLAETHRAPTPRDVRLFGAVWLPFFLLLAACAIWAPVLPQRACQFTALALVASLLFNPAPKLPQLAGLLLPGLFFLGGYPGVVGLSANTAAWTLAGIGGLGALLCWVVTAHGVPLHDLWMRAGAPIAWSFTRLVLGAVYFLVLTPIGLALRVAGRDPLQRRRSDRPESYWVKRRIRSDPKSYFRQF